MPSRKTIQFTELLEWMRKNDRKIRPLAREAHLDKMTLHRLLYGQPKRFDPDLIRKISLVTGGKIAEPQFLLYFGRLNGTRKRAA